MTPNPMREALLAARGDDPLVRWSVADRTDGELSLSNGLLVVGRNVAWRGRASRPGEHWVTGLGEDPKVVANLVAELAAQGRTDGITISQDAFTSLPSALQSPDPGHWSYWTRSASPHGLNPQGAHKLDPQDSRIDGLLAHSNSAHVFPGDERVVEWYGVEEGEQLQAVAARMKEPSGAAHLVSVCTDPVSRGKGLAAQVCARALLDAIEDGAPILVLEMYVANEAGRALYTRLGFREQGRYLSGLLAGT